LDDRDEAELAATVPTGTDIVVEDALEEVWPRESCGARWSGGAVWGGVGRVGEDACANGAARGECAEETHELAMRWRDECDEACEEGLRLEGQARSAATVTLELVEDSAVVQPPEAAVGDWGAAEIAAEPFQCAPIVFFDGGLRVDLEVAAARQQWRALASPGRRRDRARGALGAGVGTR
jgi:hypothetical protein